VESIKKGRGGSGLAPKPTRVVKASKLARFITAFKSFPRRKQHELLISQAKAAMKTKKPKPKVNDLFSFYLYIFKRFFLLGNGCCSSSTSGSTCRAQSCSKCTGK